MSAVCVRLLLKYIVNIGTFGFAVQLCPTRNLQRPSYVQVQRPTRNGNAFPPFRNFISSDEPMKWIHRPQMATVPYRSLTQVRSIAVTSASTTKLVKRHTRCVSCTTKVTQRTRRGQFPEAATHSGNTSKTNMGSECAPPQNPPAGYLPQKPLYHSVS